MKTVKRIMAVFLLVIVVGYLCYTGSRLTATQETAAVLEVVYEQAQSF